MVIDPAITAPPPEIGDQLKNNAHEDDPSRRHARSQRRIRPYRGYALQYDIEDVEKHDHVLQLLQEGQGEEGEEAVLGGADLVCGVVASGAAMNLRVLDRTTFVTSDENASAV